jgi:hypothetical protein
MAADLRRMKKVQIAKAQHDDSTPKIPRPEGDRGRPENGKWNLQEAIGLADKRDVYLQIAVR